MEKEKEKEKEAIVEVARQFAKQNGHDPEKYQVASVVNRDEKFWVLFQGKSGRPGDHFDVVVGKDGKAIKLVHGE